MVKLYACIILITNLHTTHWMTLYKCNVIALFIKALLWNGSSETHYINIYIWPPFFEGATGGVEGHRWPMTKKDIPIYVYIYIYIYIYVCVCVCIYVYIYGSCKLYKYLYVCRCPVEYLEPHTVKSETVPRGSNFGKHAVVAFFLLLLSDLEIGRIISDDLISFCVVHICVILLKVSRKICLATRRSVAKTD